MFPSGVASAIVDRWLAWSLKKIAMAIGPEQCIRVREEEYAERNQEARCKGRHLVRRVIATVLLLVQESDEIFNLKASAAGDGPKRQNVGFSQTFDQSPRASNTHVTAAITSQTLVHVQRCDRLSSSYIGHTISNIRLEPQQRQLTAQAKTCKPWPLRKSQLRKSTIR